MELFDIKKHSRNHPFAPKDRDIETALLWNALQKTLKKLNRSDLFAYISAIKITPKNITITTNKPIIIQELKNYQHEIQEMIEREMLRVHTDPPERRLRFR